MTQTMPSPFLPIDEDARAAARCLARGARHGALACLDPETGAPIASRTSIAPDVTGDLVLLVSHLSAHTEALLADGRAALLLGEPGGGDPLAHPRLSLQGTALRIDREHDDYTRIRRRFLARQPGAARYVDFSDFLFLRIELAGGLFNRGFARAYRLTRPDLVDEVAVEVIGAEERVIRHMNEDHADAIDRLVRQAVPRAERGWRIATLDSDGFDAVRGDAMARIAFDRRIQKAGDYRVAFVELVSRLG